MIKIALGLITALLLAACSYTGAPTVADAGNPLTSGVGHPSTGYPGPRAY
jgi:hypothetical protein